MKADEIYGTKNPTPHRVLLDTRFELPFGKILAARIKTHKECLCKAFCNPVMSSSSSDCRRCISHADSTLVILDALGQIKP